MRQHYSDGAGITDGAVEISKFVCAVGVRSNF